MWRRVATASELVDPSLEGKGHECDNGREVFSANLEFFLVVVFTLEMSIMLVGLQVRPGAAGGRKYKGGTRHYTGLDEGTREHKAGHDRS
jgi:hypothetical protein